MLWKIMAIILVVYGLFLLFAGFTKMKTMITLAKSKLGKNASDKKAINFMYISGLALLVVGIVVTIFAF